MPNLVNSLLNFTKPKYFMFIVKISEKEFIEVPNYIKFLVKPSNLIMSNSKDQITIPINEKTIKILLSEKQLIIRTQSNSKIQIQQVKTIFNLIKNGILGLTRKFKKKLVLKGIGYRANIVENTSELKKIELKLGYSNSIFFSIPKTIDIKCLTPNTILISGFNKQEVGQVTANIRKLRYPEPYKGKGILFENEQIFLKEGKKR
nr:ribosomal protein L6 [Microheliella maris]